MTLTRKTRPITQKTQGGAALLTAMLTVVLVATLATSALWQQWRGVEIEAAERSRTQSAWVLNGALDWARLILREDARKGGADHLAEPWAVPLSQARLSTFLAADRSDSLAADQTQDAFLSGQILDLQGRLNVNNLILDGKAHIPSRIAFERLFTLLNLPKSELNALTEQLRQAQSPVSDPANQAKTPLLPQDIDQLAWLGVSQRSIAVLRPFVTLLPARTPINLNTAPAEVVYACTPTFELADAHALVARRSLAHFPTLDEANELANKAIPHFNADQHSVDTRYFEVLGNLQIDQTTVQEKSTMQRDAMDVRILTRQRGVRHTAPLQ